MYYIIYTIFVNLSKEFLLCHIINRVLFLICSEKGGFDMKKTMSKITFVVVLVFVAVLFFSASTVVTKTAKADDSAWNANPGEKLAKGLANAGLGWSEVPKEIFWNGPKNQGFWSIPLSPYNCLIGIFKGAFRTGGGTADAVTFPASGNAMKDWPLQDW
jgi:uncharacterized membrane protein YfcA